MYMNYARMINTGYPNKLAYAREIKYRVFPLVLSYYDMKLTSIKSEYLSLYQQRLSLHLALMNKTITY